MKISTVDALKIDNLLKDRAFGDVYLNDYFNLFGKNKYKSEDYLEYYTTHLSKLLDKDTIQYNHFNKYLYVLFSFFSYGVFNYKFDGLRIKELHNKYKLFLERTNSKLDPTTEEYFSKMDIIIDKSIKANEKSDKEETEDKSADESDTQVQEIKTQSVDKSDTQHEEIKVKNEDLEKENHDLKVKSKELQREANKVPKLEKEKEEKRKRIVELQREIRKYIKEIEKLNESIDKKDNNYNLLKSKYDELVTSLDNLKIEYQKLQEEYNRVFEISKNNEELRHKNEDLKEEIIDLKMALEGLKELENEVNELKDKLEASNQKVEELEETIKEMNVKSDSNSFIVSSILAILYEEPATLKEIEEKLIKKGIHYPAKELFKVFSSLGSMVNIEAKTIAEDGPIYEIADPLYVKNSFYDLVIPEENSYVDLLLTADYHIFELRPEFLKNYEALGDYATNNNIRTIVNLGDFFDFGINGYPKDLYQYKIIKKAVDISIEKIPYIPNTNQLVLGGNHDVWNMYLGFDFLKYFIDNRLDFTSLGYEKATLILKKKQDLFKILLSHTNHNLERNNLKERIENINNGLGIKQNRDLYVFGHSHESYLDLENSVCVVPSLTVDKVCNGAWHIRIYLDNNTISYKPLTITSKTGEYGRKLVPASDIIYKK